MLNGRLLTAGCPLTAVLPYYCQQGQTLGVVLKYCLLKGKGQARLEDGSSKIPADRNCPNE